MTLLETERLTRKLSGCLRGDSGNQPGCAKLAEEFAAACHAANLRLQQCEAMIRVGDRHQAIQLAETAPNLLDIVTILEFRGSEKWRSYCQETGLQVAEAIDPRSVEALNECYAQGSPTDHPLYGVYRRACLLRRDEEALRALQRITRLNPSDTNAKAELARLGAKVLAKHLLLLSDLLDGSVPGMVLEEMEVIEAFGFNVAPEDVVWRRAQEVRCGIWIEHIEALRNSFHWAEASAILDLIHRVQDEFHIELLDSQLKIIQAVQSWVHQEEEKDKNQKVFDSLLSELQCRLQQSENDATSVRRPGMPELRSSLKGLKDVWQCVQALGRTLPESTAYAFDVRTTALGIEISRLSKIRRLKAVYASVSALAGVAMASWLGMVQFQARDLAARLKDAVAKRQVHKAKALLVRANSIALKPSTLAAEDFIKNESSLLRDFQESFGKLPKQLEGEPMANDLAEISDNLSATTNRFADLAPDLKAENEPQLRAFEGHWLKFLSESHTRATSLLEASLEATEKQCAALDYRLPIEQVHSQFLTASNQVLKLVESESRSTNTLPIADELRRRLAAVKQKYSAFDQELKKLDAAVSNLTNSRAFSDYLSALETLTASPFSASVATAAKALREMNPTPESALRPLLCGDNPRVWNYLTTCSQCDFVPRSVLSAERDLYRALKDDPNTSSILYRYHLFLDLGRQTPLQWITAGRMATTGNGWREILAYRVDNSPDICRLERIKYGFFDGDYKLPNNQPIYDLEEIGPCNETASYSSLRLELLISGDEERWQSPPLKLLDKVNQSRQGSPLFRAYLFLKLVSLMELQQEESGLWFSLSARQDKARLISRGANEVRSGDWYAPRCVGKFSKRLGECFDSTQGVVYWTQAAALASLSREAFRSGFRYAGCLGANGQPVVTLEPILSELWGYTASAKSPSLLYVVRNGQLTEIEKGTALSPLFALKQSRAALLLKAGIDPNDHAFDKQLPPLFASHRHPE
jgi:hypothetical protein